MRALASFDPSEEGTAVLPRVEGVVGQCHQSLGQEEEVHGAERCAASADLELRFAGHQERVQVRAFELALGERLDARAALAKRRARAHRHAPGRARRELRELTDHRRKGRRFRGFERAARSDDGALDGSAGALEGGIGQRALHRATKLRQLNAALVDGDLGQRAAAEHGQQRRRAVSLEPEFPDLRVRVELDGRSTTSSRAQRRDGVGQLR